MNEELQKALLNIINDGRAFAASQLPEVLAQILTWRLIESAMWIVGATLWFPFVYFMLKRANSKKDVEGNFFYTRCMEMTGPWLACMCVIAIMSCVFFLAILIEPATALQVIFAPKVYLIEYAAKLATSK